MIRTTVPNRSRDTRLHHQLNAPCPDCECPQWLHTLAGCLKLRLVGGTPRAPKLERCKCLHTISDFAS